MATLARAALGVVVVPRLSGLLFSCTSWRAPNYRTLTSPQSYPKARSFWLPPVEDESYPKNEHAKGLRDALESQVSYTEGIHPVKAEDLVIYYGSGSVASRIDLASVKDEEFRALASACEDVGSDNPNQGFLGEKPRKTRQMDLTQFATRLDVVTSGLLDVIAPTILRNHDVDGKSLWAELKTLSIYGPADSSFKSGQDIAPAANKIGSLLVIFPTAYTGGALKFQQGGTTWNFDSAAQLARSYSHPHFAYVAFASDVSNAIDAVRSGHQLILTYHLLLVENTTSNPEHSLITPPAHALERTVKDTLSKLLADPSFLPTGGLLGFGLSHRYTMPAEPKWYWMDSRPHEKQPSRLGNMLELLKGSDARVRAAAEHIGLTVHIKMYYSAFVGWEYPDVVADDVVNAEEMRTSIRDAENASKEDHESASLDGFGVWVHRKKDKYTEGPPEGEPSVAVKWITKGAGFNCVKSPFVAYDYGEYITIEYLEGNLGLFIEVPAIGKGMRTRSKL